jgi:hypothetical protein
VIINRLMIRIAILVAGGRAQIISEMEDILLEQLQDLTIFLIGLCLERPPHKHGQMDVICGLNKKKSTMMISP